MGELHMDIVIGRIKNDFKVDAYIGPLQVAYREIPTQEAQHEGKKHEKFTIRTSQ